VEKDENREHQPGIVVNRLPTRASFTRSLASSTSTRYNKPENKTENKTADNYQQQYYKADNVELEINLGPSHQLSSLAIH